MFMAQTLKEYLKNPMGKGSMAITNRTMIQNDLNNRLDKLLKRYNNKLKFTVYKDKEDYYFHFLIPSETERTNTYDVVIQFTEYNQKLKYDNTLSKYIIKVFSNCPSFTYTYAYVYNDYEMMIDFLKDKYQSIVLENNPIIRNPGEIINYEKSIYFACKYIDKKWGMMTKGNLKVKILDKKELYKIIRNTDQIQLEITKENNRLNNEKIKKQLNDNVKKRHSKSETKNKGTINNTKKKQSISKIRPKGKIKPHKSTIKRT